MKAREKNSFIVTACTIAGVIFVLVIVPNFFTALAGQISPYQVFYEYHFRKLPFNAGQWKSVRRYEGNYLLRRRMLDDLRQRLQILGMKRSELEKLLGKSDQLHHPGEDCGFQNGYWIGPGHYFVDLIFQDSMGFHTEWFCIKFKDGLVIETKIFRE